MLFNGVGIVMWPFSKIKQQKAIIAQLEDKVARAMVGQIRLEDLNISERGVEMKLNGSPLHLFANAWIEQFKQSGAANYLEIEFYSQEDFERYMLILQRSNGLSSSKKAAILSELLERSINGFEWFRDNHKEIWNTSDDEFLAELKTALGTGQRNY